MEKFNWTDRVRNEVLQRVKEERNILQTIKRRKPNWISHSLRRNCILNHVIEGKTEGRIKVTERLRRRRKQLLYGLMEKTGSTRSQCVENLLGKRLWTGIRQTT